jgi:hypothetical protein
MSGRLRNWDPRTYAEVFVRLQDLEQNPSQVAQATGMSYAQVVAFKRFLDTNPTKAPQNLRHPTPEVFALVRAELANEPKLQSKPNLDGLEEDVAEFAAHARRLSSRYRISIGKFLWLVSTDIRSL